MNPKDLKLYTFVDGDFSMDVYVSIEKNNIYMNQTEIAKLLDVNQSTISRKLKNYDSSKWDSYAETQHFCIDVMQKAVDYYGLEIIKEIGQKYNPERIRKLEEWLEQIIIENSQEVIDDNFEIVRYNQGKVSLPARVDYIHRTAWLAQEEIAKLLDVTAKSISYHIANIYEEEELDKESTLQEIWIVRFEGNRKIKRLVTHYNVDMMIAIGYRVHSKAAILFRRWVSNLVNEVITDGFSYDKSKYSLVAQNTNLLYQKVEALSDDVEDTKKRLVVLESKINNDDIPQEILFEQGDFYKAYEYLAKLVESSKTSIDIVDNYADYHLTSILKNKRKEVEVRVLTSPQAKLDDTAITSFNLEYGGLSIARNSTFHDRYIIIDKNIGYHLGPSINHVGKKISQVNKINESFVLDSVLKAIDDCFAIYIP